MKIAYYIDSVIPSQKANSVHVMRMCQAFTKLGIKTTLICDADCKNEDFSNVWNQYGIIDRFEIKRAYLSKRVRRLGRRIASDYSSWLKSKIKVDADYSYSRSALTLFFLKNVRPFIYEAHTEPDNLSKVVVRKIINHKNCIGVVVISNALKNRFLELFPEAKSDSIYVLHDAADLVDETDEKVNLSDNGGAVVGYLGHLYPGKCMEILLPLAQKCPDFLFHVVGGTHYWVEYWKKECQKQNVRNVIFYGFVNNSEIGQYYRAFDICILPFSKNVFISKNKKQNIGQWISPLKLFEAMSYGKAILVSDIPTIREVMDNEKDCLLADPECIDDWVEKLSHLCADSEFRKQLGIAARIKLEKQYTWEIRAKKAAEILSHSIE